MSTLLWLALLAAATTATPYRLMWGVPLDESTAVEIDTTDLAASKYDSLWALAQALQACAAEHRTKARPFGVAVREVRIDTLDSDGNPRISQRCQKEVVAWQKMLGEDAFERLENELDAHISFLRPRRQPGDPPLLAASPSPTPVNKKIKNKKQKTIFREKTL